MADLHSESMDRLFHTILSLQSVEECYRFFEDLCTIKELQDLSQRMDTAVLLDRGENYAAIGKTVGVSTATISRVNRCLQYGAGGYRTALDRMAASEAEEEKRSC